MFVDGIWHDRITEFLVRDTDRSSAKSRNLFFLIPRLGNFRMRGQHGENSPVSGEIIEGWALSSDRSGRHNLNERCSWKRDVPVLIEPVSRNSPGKKSVS